MAKKKTCRQEEVGKEDRQEKGPKEEGQAKKKGHARQTQDQEGHVALRPSVSASSEIDFGLLAAV